jgi:hypothetical protein
MYVNHSKGVKPKKEGERENEELVEISIER